MRTDPQTNFGKRRATRNRPGSWVTTHRSEDWARSFSSLMPRKNHIGLMPAGIKTRIAGSAAGLILLTRGWENVFHCGLQVRTSGKKRKILSFPLWNKVEKESRESQAGSKTSLVENSQLRQPWRSGCAPAEPYPPRLHPNYTKKFTKKK